MIRRNICTSAGLATGFPPGKPTRGPRIAGVLPTRVTRLSGFTLVELLVVIGIIGILIGLSVVAFQSTRVSARDAKRKADLSEIRSALEIYRTDCGEYPSSVTFGSALSGGVTSCTGNVYMASVPNDPINAGGSRKYYYARLSVNTYELCAALEQGGSATCGGSCTVSCNYKVISP